MEFSVPLQIVQPLQVPTYSELQSLYDETAALFKMEQILNRVFHSTLKDAAITFWHLMHQLVNCALHATLNDVALSGASFNITAAPFKVEYYKKLALNVAYSSVLYHLSRSRSYVASLKVILEI